MAYAVGGEGGASAGGDGHALAVEVVAADGAIPEAVGRSGAADDEGEVGFVERAVFELGGEGVVGGVVFGDDEDAAGFAVEAVDDAGTQDAADAGEAGTTVVEEGGDEGAGGAAGARVNDETRGFVEGEKIVVFVKYFEGDVFRGDAVGHGRWGQGDDGVPGAGKLAGCEGASAGGDATLGEPLLQAGAGDAELGGECFIGSFGAVGFLPDASEGGRIHGADYNVAALALNGQVGGG